jgi:MoxR-like ATPase
MDFVSSAPGGEPPLAAPVMTAEDQKDMQEWVGDYGVTSVSDLRAAIAEAFRLLRQKKSSARRAARLKKLTAAEQAQRDENLKLLHAEFLRAGLAQERAEVREAERKRRKEHLQQRADKGETVVKTEENSGDENFLDYHASEKKQKR